MKVLVTTFCASVAGLIGSSSNLIAQTSFINPNPNGGYTVFSPGQPRTFVDPNPYGGGYTVTTPGQPRTFIDRNPYGGGYTVTTPGQGSYGNSGYNRLMNRRNPLLDD